MNIALCITFVSSLLLAQADHTTPVQIQQIERAIEQLSSRDFAVRHEATMLLWEAGEAARSALERAVGSGDREVAYRAQSILEKFRYGVFPDTPPDVVQLIQSYRQGDSNTKRDVVSQLQQKGAARSIIALFENEQDATLRQQLAAQIMREIETLAPRLLRDDAYEELEQLLELAVSTGEGAGTYATFLYLRGDLEEHIERLQQQVQRAPEARSFQLLAAMHRIRGDMSAALEAAGQAGDEPLQRTILLELQRWNELAELHDDETVRQSVSTYRKVEHLALAAAYYRRAGDEQEFDEALNELRALSDNASLLWHVAESLLLNGQLDEGIELMWKASEEAAFRILCAQTRFEEAFAAAGIEDLNEQLQPWIEALLEDARATDSVRRQRFDLGVHVARALAHIGWRDEARQLFEQLAEVAGQDEDGHQRRRRTLARMAARSGFESLARDTIAGAIDAGANLSAMEDIFRDEQTHAANWWRFFVEQYPEEAGGTTLQRIASLLQQHGLSMEPEEVELLCRDAEHFAPQLPPDEQAAFRFTLADTLLRHGLKKQAIAMLEPLAESHGPAALKRGDLAFDDGRWEEAAGWYRRAFEIDSAQALALYLHGYVLQRAGQSEVGQEAMRKAQLVTFDAPARHALASGMNDRGLQNEAIDQWKLVQRAGLMTDWHANDAAKNIGNAISSQEPLRAAAGWERLLLSALRTSSSFTEAEGYVQLPQLVYKVRGRALLDAEKTEEAIETLSQAQAALPGSIALLEEFVPRLDEIGHRDLADQWFAQAYRLHEALIRLAPQAATHYNNLAWLAARCDRRLDDAFELAEKAVSMEPDNAAYIDTLAEVHFRLGNVDEAIRLIHKCLEMEPDTEHFHEQRQRFESQQATGEQTSD